MNRIPDAKSITDRHRVAIELEIEKLTEELLTWIDDLFARASGREAARSQCRDNPSYDSVTTTSHTCKTRTLTAAKCTAGMFKTKGYTTSIDSTANGWHRLTVSYTPAVVL